VLCEEECRLILFSIIEPSDLFWSNEIFKLGAQVVLDLIISQKHYPKSNKLSSLSDTVKGAILSKLQVELVESQSTFITPRDEDWPIGVNDLPNPPIGLDIKGDRASLSKLKNSISIVGSRKPTDYGVEITKSLAKQAVMQDYLIVSGGAIGIDTAAHIGALSYNGITISVLAGGFNNLYPAENRRLFTQVKTNGLLISEVMPNISTKPNRFLTRNRVIAALSGATIVVEAEYVSGSIRAARNAAEIFRPVFAIPGPITSALSEGCHRLISERVADIATSFDEIMELITPLQVR
jgi:DNA processing protein